VFPTDATVDGEMPRRTTSPRPNDPFLLAMRLLREEVPSFDVYPFNLPVVRGLHELPLDAKVTFLIGENGSGKSTLVEAIAVAAGYNPEGGSRDNNFETRRSDSELHRHVRLVRSWRRPRTGYFLRTESFYNMGTEVDRLSRFRAVSQPSRLTAVVRRTSNRTASPSSRCSRTGSDPTGSTSSTSPRPPSHRSDSSRCWSGCIT
jgi:hypothetical protein